MIWYKKRKEKEVQNGLIFSNIRKYQIILYFLLFYFLISDQGSTSFSFLFSYQIILYFPLFSFLTSVIFLLFSFLILYFLLFSFLISDHFVLPSLSFSYIRSFCTSFSFLFLYQIILATDFPSPIQAV